MMIGVTSPLHKYKDEPPRAFGSSQTAWNSWTLDLFCAEATCPGTIAGRKQNPMAMHKVVANADEAIHDIKDGDTLMIGLDDVADPHERVPVGGLLKQPPLVDVGLQVRRCHRLYPVGVQVGEEADDGGRWSVWHRCPLLSNALL